MGRRNLLIAGTLLALLWLVVPGLRTLTEPDEGRYAEIPREMLASGDWIVPHLNGMQYLEKPPLQYWATALAYVAIGVTPWASRLYGILLALACLVLVRNVGTRLWGERAGTLAAAALASAPLYAFMAQINTLDMGLTFLLTVALGAFLHAQAGGDAGAPAANWRAAMRLAWLALALAFLQKGLVAFALPALAIAIYSLAQRDTALWTRLQLGAGAAIVALVCLPWIVAISLRQPGFLWFFFVREHLLRYATSIEQRGQPWWFFFAILAMGLLPWLPAAARGVYHALHKPAAALTPRSPQMAASPESTRGFDPARFLAIWAGVVFVFYSLSNSKLAPYILPMLPPLALLAGRDLAARERARDLLPLAACSIVTLGLCAAAGPLLAHLAKSPLERAAMLAFGQPVIPAAAAGLVALLLLTAFAAMRRITLPNAWALGAVATSAALTVVTLGTNALEPLNGGPSIAAQIAPQLRPDTPFYCVGDYPQTVTFALARTCILVVYRGELVKAFDDGEPNWLPTLDAFETRWRAQPGAIAIVAPRSWEMLQTRGLPVQTIASTPQAVVIKNPMLAAR